MCVMVTRVATAIRAIKLNVVTKAIEVLGLLDLLGFLKLLDSQAYSRY
jgi:hypothetical protein